MYINVTTGQYPVTQYQIQQENANTSFAEPFEAPGPYQWVFPTPTTHNPKLQFAVEIQPILTDKGHYEQQWEYHDYTPEQIADFAEQERLMRIPVSVSPAQFREALLNANLLDTVNTAVASLPRKNQIKWEFAVSVERKNQDLNVMAEALGITQRQLDDIFTEANTL